jgi:hypothetical protein
MRCVSGLKLWVAAMAFAGGALPCAAQPRAAESGAATLTAAAHSAQVSLEAGSDARGLRLRLSHTADRTPLSATGLSVSVEGRSAAATARPDGSWFVPLARAVGAGDRLEVVVAHDGIQEVLSARFTAAGDAGGGRPEAANAAGGRASGASPPGGGASGLWRDHKQMAWWILNIAVVLIAAIAISRRMS